MILGRNHRNENHHTCVTHLHVWFCVLLGMLKDGRLGDGIRRGSRKDQ
jgi:hypothetical protein